MKLEVLVSCMGQNDIDIVKKSRIVSDVLIINQCEKKGEEFYHCGNQAIRKMDFPERGLSRSRNRAIENAQGDICLICDDDEVFEKHYEERILKAFGKNPEADIIVFRMVNRPCRLKPCVHRLSYLECLKVSSWQIAFRRKSIIDTKIRFDIYMGAGTGNGGGEEIKFLLDCYKEGLKIYHVPVEIATVAQTHSTWFEGFSRRFFYERGISTRYMLGFPMAVTYAFYYIVRKRSLYRKDISMLDALTATLSGIWNNDIQKQWAGRKNT